MDAEQDVSKGIRLDEIAGIFVQKQASNEMRNQISFLEENLMAKEGSYFHLAISSGYPILTNCWASSVYDIDS